MKLATTDGSVDVSQVIAALDWVTQHPVLPDGTRVRVINLSYGTDSAQSYLADPLAAAAENAWRIRSDKPLSASARTKSVNSP